MLDESARQKDYTSRGGSNFNQVAIEIAHRTVSSSSLSKGS
jgi:hypothetical protein